MKFSLTSVQIVQCEVKNKKNACTMDEYPLCKIILGSTNLYFFFFLTVLKRIFRLYFFPCLSFFVLLYFSFFLVKEFSVPLDFFPFSCEDVGFFFPLLH